MLGITPSPNQRDVLEKCSVDSDTGIRVKGIVTLSGTTMIVGVSVEKTGEFSPFIQNDDDIEPVYMSQTEAKILINLLQNCLEEEYR